MSEEGEYIVVNIDTDSDTSSDDGDEQLSEHFGSDVIPDTSSDGDWTVESDFEDPDDNFEEQSLHDTEDENDEDNIVNVDDEDDRDDDNEDVEENIPPENLNGSNPSSVGFPPGNNRSQPSAPDDFMHLEDLLERTNRQITHIFETVSIIQEFSEVSEMEKCGNCGESFNQTEQASQDQDNPEETVPEPVAEAEPEELVSDQDTVPFDEGAQGTNSVTSSEQPAVEAPLIFLQPVDTILVTDPNGVIYPVVVGVENISRNTLSPLVYIPSNLEMPGIAEANVENHTLTINNPTLEENQEEEDTFIPPVFHNFDIPVIPEAVLEGSPETVNYPPAMGNGSGQQNPSSSVGPVSDSEINEVILVELPKKAEAIVNGCKQTVYYPALLGRVVPPDPETLAASVSSESVIHPDESDRIQTGRILQMQKSLVLQERRNSNEIIIRNIEDYITHELLLGMLNVIEKLVLIEVPVHPASIVDDNSETLNNPIIPENVGSQEPAAASFVSSSGIELSDSEENNSQIMNNPHVLENNGSQTMSGSVFVNQGIGAAPEIIPQIMNCATSTKHVNDHGNDLVHISDQEGYLGDPRRNIRLSNFHLEAAKNKPTPSCATCYLANLILSEEILLNTVADQISHCIFTDHNKMSAIREYLMTVFTNYDLSEQGKDWEDCLSAVHFMTEKLYAETEIPKDRNFSVPISTNWNIRNGYVEGEGPSQCFQEVRETVIREIGSCEQNVSANPENTDTAIIIPDELVYLGDPSRNIPIPYSVLKIAKTRLRPDLSAKYIILHLFPEKILIRSNVYGNTDCGLFALDSNRIDALKEFLQDNYPDYDLEETEYYWKLCVTAINICLQTLRQDPRLSFTNF